MTFIQDLDELAGKTIRAATDQGNEICFRFEDGSYFVARANCDECEHDDFVWMQIENSASDVSLVNVGAISFTEYERRCREQMEVDEKYQESQERADYERLKAKFEGKP